MNDDSKSSRTQIIVAVIGVVGAIAVAVVSQFDWNGLSDNGPREQANTEQVKQTDSLKGFYVRDGLANSPVLKITPIGGHEYKFEVFNHPWPWEATVRLSGSDLTGYGRFPKSKATMDFKGRISGDGAIYAEYHFITKGDGTPANGRVDSHIWTLRKG
ncbi:MAG: hypothetical protein ACJAUL_001848 [Paraglaciecola sp.]|jgi:hypothetical protein